ncbi:hypothetical protein HBB16_08545 [Pseudonocardia sp. MCCB 268]|nr:hypothetical protein [Pseudonocardia cytotoxica]
MFGALAAGEEYLLLCRRRLVLAAQAGTQALRALIENPAAGTGPRTGCGSAGSRPDCGRAGALGVIDHQARAWREQVSGLLELDGSRAPLPRLTPGSCGPTSAAASAGWPSLWRHQLGGILADLTWA